MRAVHVRRFTPGVFLFCSAQRIGVNAEKSQGADAGALGLVVRREFLDSMFKQPNSRDVIAGLDRLKPPGTPLLIASIAAASGILDRPLQCAIAHKAGDDG